MVPHATSQDEVVSTFYIPIAPIIVDNRRIAAYGTLCHKGYPRYAQYL